LTHPEFEPAELWLWDAFAWDSLADLAQTLGLERK